METQPFYIALVFGLTVVAALMFFYKATNQSKTFTALLLVWLTFQSFLGLSGFYQEVNSFPPRFGLLALPAIILIIVLFRTEKGRAFIDSLNIKTLTLFHIIRIPVELVLFWLFVHKTVPELMTFEGRNFDILSGLSAPLVYYFGFVKNTMSKKMMLIWNFVCLGLLINIVASAILSLPTAFQQFGFEQPNIAVLYFPYVLLPSVLVPLVLFSHLVSIRQLLKRVN